MAAAKMRHFNSPEELARRAGDAVSGGVSKAKEFRHYNHPEEVARRLGRERAPEVWPPPGETNDAPAAPPVLVEAAATTIELGKPDTQPPPPRRDSGERLRRVELLLTTLVEDEAEARHFRMLLSNQQAVTESQQGLINRVRALELSLDQLLEQLTEPEDGDGAPKADGDPEALELTGSDAEPPTRAVNGKPET